MLGIILWSILIFVIMCYACPGFITALFVCMAVVFGLECGTIYLINKLKNRK